jgi:hypothetical protein
LSHSLGKIAKRRPPLVGSLIFGNSTFTAPSFITVQSSVCPRFLHISGRSRDIRHCFEMRHETNVWRSRFQSEGDVRQNWTTTFAWLNDRHSSNGLSRAKTRFRVNLTSENGTLNLSEMKYDIPFSDMNTEGSFAGASIGFRFHPKRVF